MDGIQTFNAPKEARDQALRRDGIKVHPPRLEDYRTITQMLNEGSHKYHAFRPPGDKALRAVLRDILQTFSTKEIKLSLTEVGCDVKADSRIHKKVEEARIDMPLVLV